MKTNFKTSTFFFLVVALVAIVAIAFAGPIASELWFALSIGVMALSVIAAMIGYTHTHKQH